MTSPNAERRPGSSGTPSSHDQADLLREKYRSLQVLELRRSNHFPFLDQPNVFNRLLLDFLASEGTPVEIKAEWRRRVSQLEYM